MSQGTASVTFKGNPITLSGHGASKGDPAPPFTLVANDLSPKSLADYRGKVIVLSSVPSLDTGICSTETKRFNQEAAKLGDDVVILTVSRDLPFAQKRWCGAEGVDRVVTLSDFRHSDFGEKYGVTITDGPLEGLLARCVFVIDREGRVVYRQLVPEIAQEPDYDPVLAAAKSAV